MIERALMLIVGLPLIASGIGPTMVGIFAFLGTPTLGLGLGLALASAAAGPPHLNAGRAPATRRGPPRPRT
jgi:hypothetical protein